MKNLQQTAAHSMLEQNSLHLFTTVHHLTDDSFQNFTNEEEDFPTAPLDDDIWIKEPVPDRHFCFHEQSQPHDLCPYPCLYSLDQLHPTPENAPTPHYEMIELSDLFDLPHLMTTTSNEDIPDLDDVFGF